MFPIRHPTAPIPPSDRTDAIAKVLRSGELGERLVRLANQAAAVHIAQSAQQMRKPREWRA